MSKDTSIEELRDELVIIMADFLFSGKSLADINKLPKSESEKGEKTIDKLLALIAAKTTEARKGGILEGFKMSAEGWNGEYPYGDRAASDEEILADILPPELQAVSEKET